MYKLSTRSVILMTAIFFFLHLIDRWVIINVMFNILFCDYMQVPLDTVKFVFYFFTFIEMICV